MPASFRILALVGAALTASGAVAQDVRTGAAAFGDWRTDAPGVTRKITPADLPKPLATPSNTGAYRRAARPENAKPTAPAGFKVELLASGLSGPRVLRAAPNGDLFIAESAAGRVRVLRMEEGKARLETFATGLNGAFGIAFPPGPEATSVYIATPAQVLRFPYKAGDMRASGASRVIVSGLPTGGHSTRDLAFSRDGGTLYVSLGSAGNIAADLARRTPAEVAAHERATALGAAWGVETDRANVLAFDAEGGNKRIFATGLRNCSGLATAPDGALWCVVNERDALGDDLPPDYATRVREGAFYGWPWYYTGGNEDPRHAGARPDLKDKVTVPDVLFQAHSAPLGITFQTSGAFPEEWRGAYVAMHGSWNRAKAGGYKVVRVIFRDGQPTGEYQDFLTGFVIDDRSMWGRPVGIAVMNDGALVVGEDANGTLWRVTRER